MKGLIKDLFEENMKGIFHVRSEELSKDNMNLKCCRCDLVVDTKDSILLLEVQNKNLKDFKKRLKKYVSLLYAEQKCDEDYGNLKPVKVYLIINYQEGERKAVKHFMEQEKELYEQFDDLSEIKVFNLVSALKGDKNSLEYKYARLFKLDKLKKEKAIQILKEYWKDERLKEMVEGIMLYNLDEENYRKLKEELVMEESWELATSGIRAWGERIGERRGIKIGKERGEKSGRKAAQKEIAANLIKEGVPLELIAKATKLSVQEIQSYVKN